MSEVYTPDSFDFFTTKENVHESNWERVIIRIDGTADVDFEHNSIWGCMVDALMIYLQTRYLSDEEARSHILDFKFDHADYVYNELAHSYTTEVEFWYDAETNGDESIGLIQNMRKYAEKIVDVMQIMDISQGGIRVELR